MDRALHRPLTIPWRFVLLVSGLTGMTLAVALAWDVVAPIGNDWRILVGATQAADPYSSGLYVYTPLFTVLFGTLVVPLGLHAVIAAHLASLLLIRDRLALTLIVAAPVWWMVVALGNVYWFQVLVGYWALRGNRWAGVGTLAAFALLPRPMFVPLVAWLLWQRVSLRVPAVAIVAVAVAANIATGQAGEWLAAAILVSGEYSRESPGGREGSSADEVHAELGAVVAEGFDILGSFSAQIQPVDKRLGRAARTTVREDGDSIGANREAGVLRRDDRDPHEAIVAAIRVI